ncbi:MAG TPA: hypothetical protein VFE58_17415 [Tepidisphaeraceae bacterium]|nr:hypothetical protein [Tepidisphaeraceae bacterium]
MKTSPIIISILCLSALARAQSVQDVKFPVYQTKYYEIHTDLTGDALREAELRMTKMAEEYRARTRMFFGAADQRLPFYLFRKAKDYYATGVPEDSSGVFTGTALLALAGEKTDLQTWHVIQHEGFHQYVNSVIGPNLPIWLNEGMAEYFGEALFTGDSFVSGLIPPWRLTRVQESLKNNEFVPLKDMLGLPVEQWNAKLSVNNYDQAWSMVQFLAHADNGRYEHLFVSFISAVGRGKQWQTAWRESFGPIEPFEARWKSYWANLPPDPTGPLYGQVAMRILTSFLARSYTQDQHFNTYSDFATALNSNKVQIPPDDWLPPSLATDALGLAKTLGDWTLNNDKGALPHLTLILKDNTQISGYFTLRRDGRIQSISAPIEGKRLRR